MSIIFTERIFNMKLEGKVAIITGATAGIGRACALRFAAEGAKVVAAGRNAEKGASVVEEIKAAGGEAIFVQTDMKKEADMDNLLAKAVEAYGKIDILYNNAGIAYSAPLAQYDQVKFDEILEVNLRSPYLMCKKAMPYLVETKGCVLNTSSISGLKAQHNGYAYNASKTALIRITEILALEFAPVGVRCNAICPGVTKTDILDTVAPEQLKQLAAAIPMGRLGEPDEIAKASVFMVSDDASYMTGQSIAIDGGYCSM